MTLKRFKFENLAKQTMSEFFDAENIIKSYCANEKCSFGRITINATSPTLAKDKLTELAEIGFSTQDIAEIYCC